MLEKDDLTPDYHLVNEHEIAAQEAIKTRNERIARGEGPGKEEFKFVEVDRDTVIKLARLHCSYADIGRWFGVHEHTIMKRFREDIETAKTETRARLRNKMLEKAMNGDTTMLIWVSKNWLGFSDNGPVDNDDKKPLPWKED